MYLIKDINIQSGIHKASNKNLIVVIEPGACAINLLTPVINSVTLKAVVFVKGSRKLVIKTKGLLMILRNLLQL